MWWNAVNLIGLFVFYLNKLKADANLFMDWIPLDIPSNLVMWNTVNIGLESGRLSRCILTIARQSSRDTRVASRSQLPETPPGQCGSIWSESYALSLSASPLIINLIAGVTRYNAQSILACLGTQSRPGRRVSFDRLLLGSARVGGVFSSWNTLSWCVGWVWVGYNSLYWDWVRKENGDFIFNFRPDFRNSLE